MKVLGEKVFEQHYVLLLNVSVGHWWNSQPFVSIQIDPVGRAHQLAKRTIQKNPYMHHSGITRHAVGTNTRINDFLIITI